jgi:hypothetical protein
VNRVFGTHRLLCLAEEPAEQAGKGRCAPDGAHPQSLEGQRQGVTVRVTDAYAIQGKIMFVHKVTALTLSGLMHVNCATTQDEAATKHAEAILSVQLTPVSLGSSYRFGFPKFAGKNVR